MMDITMANPLRKGKGFNLWVFGNVAEDSLNTARRQALFSYCMLMKKAAAVSRAAFENL
jgi:hypothetical protein